MKLPSTEDRLSRSFYDRDPAEVARELLGKALLRRLDGQWIGGWIVETEAYLSASDPASHSARGKTASNAAMFGPPGTLYVYPIHARYCMNAVTEGEGTASAVLIRAFEPVWGIERMRENRNVEDLRRLARGPAMLCEALRVDRQCDALDLSVSDDLMIAGAQPGEGRITVSPRVGISSAVNLQLRYFLDGNWFVSGRARDHRTPPVRPELELREDRD